MSFSLKKENLPKIYGKDYRTGIKHTLVQKPLTRENLDDFVDCYCSGHMQDRVPTYSVDNPNGRWRKFSKEEVYARDQLKLDFKWIVSEEDDDRTLAEMIAQIKEEATSIAGAVAELENLSVRWRNNGYQSIKTKNLGFGYPW